MSKLPRKLFGLFPRMRPSSGALASKDEQVRQVLADHVDDGRTPRETTFYFYGGDFDGLAKVARSAGYKARYTAKTDGIILSGLTAVDSQSFEIVGAQMEAWADEFACEYDGWETAVSPKPN